jgi:Helix-turn-helix domain
MDRREAQLEWRKLNGFRTALDNLDDIINKADQTDPGYKIQLADWQTVMKIADRVSYLGSIPEYVFDGKTSTIRSLIHGGVRPNIQDKMTEIEDFLQAEEQNISPTTDVDRILDGKNDVGIVEAATYLGRSRAHVYKLARANSITVTKKSRPQRFLSESLRAYLRPNAVKARS